MAKTFETTLYSNFDYNFDDYKEFYQETYGLTDSEMKDVVDATIYEFIDDLLNDEWTDLIFNLRQCQFADTPCVVCGSLGLWNGRHNIEAQSFNGIETAIMKCCKNVDSVIVKQINGHIEIDGMHHDGTNHFEIHFLNDRGINARERICSGYGNANLENRCYHQAIKGYLF